MSRETIKESRRSSGGGIGGHLKERGNVCYRGPSEHKKQEMGIQKAFSGLQGERAVAAYPTNEVTPQPKEPSI